MPRLPRKGYTDKQIGINPADPMGVKITLTIIKWIRQYPVQTMDMILSGNLSLRNDVYKHLQSILIKKGCTAQLAENKRRKGLAVAKKFRRMGVSR